MNNALLARLGLALAITLAPALALAAAAQPPALDCHQPTPPPKKGASAPQVVAYNKALPKYRKCIQAYVGARTADAQKYTKLAQANAKAANEAVEVFNAFVKKVDTDH